MTILATIRPDSWNFPLLLHVLGAMLLVGGLVAAVTAVALAWRRDSGWYTRLGFWSLLAVALPGWILMRIGGQWIYSKEFGEGADDPAWVGIGLITADGGGLLLLVAIVLTGIGMRRLRAQPEAGASVLPRIGAVLAALVLLAYVVAVWAMTAKPD